MIEKSGEDIQFYCPKIEYHQHFKNKVYRLEKFVLENYIFCYHTNFSKSIFMNKLRFIKGLKYFLNGYCQNQNEIIRFIEYCKHSENHCGWKRFEFFLPRLGRVPTKCHDCQTF